MNDTHNQDGLKLKNYDIETAKKIGEKQRAKLPVCDELYALMERVLKRSQFCDEIIQKLKNEENPSPLSIIKYFRLEESVEEKHLTELSGIVDCLTPMVILRTTVEVDGKTYEVEEFIESWSEFFAQYSMDKSINAKAKFFQRMENELEDTLTELTQVIGGIRTYAKKFYENNKPKIHKWLAGQLSDDELVKLADATAREDEEAKKEKIKESFFFKKWVAFNRKKPQLFHNTKVLNFIKNNYVLIDGVYQDVNTTSANIASFANLDLSSPTSGL